MVFGGLPLRFEVWKTFPRSQHFLKNVATVRLGRLVSSTVFEIVAPPFSIPTMKACSSSLTSFP